MRLPIQPLTWAERLLIDEIGAKLHEALRKADEECDEQWEELPSTTPSTHLQTEEERLQIIYEQATPSRILAENCQELTERWDKLHEPTVVLAKR